MPRKVKSMLGVHLQDNRKKVEEREEGALTATLTEARLRSAIPTDDSKEGQRVLQKFKRAINYDPLELGVWSDEARVEAVTAYITLGKMPKVELATGIPLNTLWYWKKYSSWWTELEKTIRGEQNNEYSAVISDIVTDSLLAIKDRVKKGDFIYNPRSGETVRVPVSALSLIHI